MHTNHITQLLDLPDLLASEVIYREDKIIFFVKAKEEFVTCPVCGTLTDKVHDRRWQNITDSPIRGKHVILRLDKKRYRCAICSNRGFSQAYDSIDLYARTTKRFDEYLANQAAGRDYSRVAKENNLSYTAVENAVKKQIDPIIVERTSRINGLKAISIDEFAVLKHHKYGVVISDPINKEIVDILPSRKKDDLIRYFSNWTQEQRDKIQIFSMDMWNPYKVVAEAIFPNAEITIDKFHLVALMNKALDEVRKDAQSAVSEAHRKQFYMSRTLLKKRAEDLDDKSHQKLVRIFELYPPLEVAWELKEEFRDVLQMSNLTEAVDALKSWYQAISNSKLTPFLKVKQTIRHWEKNILNYFKTGVTNGFAEGINNKIKLIKRIGYGVPNINNLKRRVFHSMI
jgi:transposase